jgi:hypothetical protein
MQPYQHDCMGDKFSQDYRLQLIFECCFGDLHNYSITYSRHFYEQLPSQRKTFEVYESKILITSMFSEVNFSHTKIVTSPDIIIKLFPRQIIFPYLNGI